MMGLIATWPDQTVSRRFTPSRAKLDEWQSEFRVVKWLGNRPALGVCTVCKREFKVPLAKPAKLGR